MSDNPEESDFDVRMRELRMSAQIEAFCTREPVFIVQDWFTKEILMTGGNMANVKYIGRYDAEGNWKEYER